MPPQQPNEQPAQPAGPATAPVSVPPATGNYKPATAVISEGELAHARTVVDEIGAMYRSRVVGQDC